LPPKTLPEELDAWSQALEAAMCDVQQSTFSVAAEGVLFLGLEYDASGADEIALVSESGTLVGKGASACVPVELDKSGYFYWFKSNGKRERTRPSWKQTNFITCRRSSTGRRITWECYHVPARGDEPEAAKKALVAHKEAAAAESKAKWAARQETASKVATMSLKAIGAAAPVVAGGVKIAATGAAIAVDITGDIAAKVIPKKEEEMQIDPDVRGTVAAVRDVTKAGAQACDAARQGVEAGAAIAGRKIVKQMSKMSVDKETVEESPGGSGSELASAGEKAVEGIGLLLKEMDAARSLVSKRASAAVVQTVGARYGAQAEETMGDALEAVGNACDFHASSHILSKKGMATTAATHTAIGAANGDDSSKTSIVLGAGSGGSSSSTSASSAAFGDASGYPSASTDCSAKQAAISQAVSSTASIAAEQPAPPPPPPPAPRQRWFD